MTNEALAVQAVEPQYANFYSVRAVVRSNSTCGGELRKPDERAQRRNQFRLGGIITSTSQWAGPSSIGCRVVTGQWGGRLQLVESGGESVARIGRNESRLSSQRPAAPVFPPSRF